MSPAAQRYDVSDWLTDSISGFEPRDVSLLYASDRKLFNVTSSPGIVGLNRDYPRSSGAYSLALLAEYQPNVSARVFLLCFKMAIEDATILTKMPTYGAHEITISVSENVPIGTVLVEYIGAVVGIQGGYHYNIVSGNDLGLFRVDHVTGNVSTLAEVDYEQRRFHRLVIRMTEIETEAAIFAVVVINVDDVNEFRPLFPVPVYRRTVSGSQSADTFVTNVRALDRDAGRFGRLQYRPETPTSAIVVDRTSGHMWLRNPVTSPGDVVIRLEFTVVAEDLEGWGDHTRVEITIRRGPTETEMSPGFAADTFEFATVGSATVGHVIGRLSVNGTGSRSTALFFVRHPSRYFDVDRHTGRVVVVRDLRSLSSRTASQV